MLGENGNMQSASDVWSQAAEVLKSERAAALLGCMVYELTLAARSRYGPEGSMPSGSEYPLRCINELLHRTGMQLRQLAGMPDAGYPTDAYLETIRHEAENGGLLAELEDVIRRALTTAEGL